MGEKSRDMNVLVSEFKKCNAVVILQPISRQKTLGVLPWEKQRLA